MLSINMIDYIIGSKTNIYVCKYLHYVILILSYGNENNIINLYLG